MKFKFQIFFILLLLTTLIIKGQHRGKDFDAYKDILNISINSDTFYNKIIVLKKDINSQTDSSILSRDYFYLGLLYYRSGLYDSAVKYNLKAMTFFRELKDTLNWFLVLQNISGAYGYMEKGEISLFYSQKAYELAQNLRDTMFIIGSGLNMAMNLIDLDREKEGFELFDKILVLAQDLGDTDRLAYIYNNLGYLYSQKHDYKKAKYFISKSLKIVEKRPNYETFALIYSNMASMYWYAGQYDSAVYFAERAIRIAKENRTIFYPQKTYNILITSLLKLKKTEQALDKFRDFLKIEDSLVMQQQNEQIARMKILYNIDKFETEIKLLTAENKLKEEKLKISKLKFNFALLLIVLVVIVLIIFIIQNSKLKQSYKKIVDANLRSLKIEQKYVKLKKEVIKDTDRKKNYKGLDELYEKIKEVMEEKKLYKQPDLNLDLLARELNTNRTYVSKAINEKEKKSFVEFINEYRIEEAKKLLCDPANKNLTIEAIGMEAGFKSKSTFFRVFKQITGVTPSFFAQNLNKEEDLHVI